MRRALARLWHRLMAFPAAQQGAAAVEFVLVVPFMLLLYVGSIEISTAITLDRRISVIAGSVGDLVARTEATIRVSDINDYFRAADAIMAPYDRAILRQTVSSVFIDNAGRTSVRWSSGHNGGPTHAVGAPFALPTEVTTLARNTCVIVAETRYVFTPMFGLTLNNSLGLGQDLTAIPLYRESYHLPRFGGCIARTA